MSVSSFSSLKCYPWLETDAAAAGRLVGLYAQLTDTLHHKFRGGWVRFHEAFISAGWTFLLSGALKLFLTACARSRSSAARPERCTVVVSDAVLRELHLPADARVPPLPVPHAPPQPALETPAPRHSANEAAVQCESPGQPTPDPTHHH